MLIFNLEDLKKEIKFKLINKTKKTEYIGILDEMGRTPRFFGDQANDIEVILLNNITEDDKWRVADELDQEHDHSEEGCCSAPCENDDSDTNEYQDDDLENDFQSFGR